MIQFLNPKIFCMKPITFFSALIFVLLTSCNNTTPKEEKNATATKHYTMEDKVYQCPMHPHIIKDETGSCPVCGMDLEQKNYHEALMFLSNFKKEKPNYKDGDELLKDLEHNQ